MLKRLSASDVSTLLYIFLVATGALLNLAFYPIMGRVLSLQDYANLGVINTISLQISAVAVALGIVVIDTYRGRSKEDAERAIAATRAYLTKVFACLLLLSVVFWPFLKNSLHLPGYIPLIVLAVYALISIPAMFMGGYHQSKSAFITMGIYGVVLALTKIIASYSISYIWNDVSAIALGLVIAQLCGVVFLGTRIPKKTFLTVFGSSGNDNLTTDKRFLVSTVLTIFCLLLLTNIDVMIIKQKQADIAWQYIGPSMIMNAVIFFSTTLAYILVGRMAELSTVRRMRRALSKTLLFWLAGISAFAVGALLFSEQVIMGLLGSRYIITETASYVRLSFLLYCSMGLLYILANYLLILRNNYIARLSALCLVICALFGIFSNLVEPFIISCIAVISFVNLGLLLHIFYRERQ